MINKSIDADFDAWWAHVPRKVAKGAARKAYRVARRKADAEVLLAGAKRWMAESAGKEPQFVKHPATWLNGECWLDEPIGVGVVETPEQAAKRAADDEAYRAKWNARMDEYERTRKWLSTWGSEPDQGLFGMYTPRFAVERYREIRRRK